MADTTTIDFFETSYSETVQDDGYDQSGQQSFMQQNISQSYNSAPTSFEDEPPLWEELGLDPDLIREKTMAILFKRSRLREELLNDTDLGGPFFFCLLLGGALMLGGKLRFGYLFGYSFTGSLAMYILLNLMTPSGIGLNHTMSVLGYSQAPMIALALASIVFPPTGMIGLLIALAIVAYCTQAASLMFTKVLQVADEGLLFAYPILLLYACFALLVMF